jgi:glutathione S-transferase
MPRNAAKLAAPFPALIVITPRDPFPQGEDYIRQKAPPRALSRLLKVDTVAATEPLLSILDAHLAQRPFMAGDRLMMADILIASEMHPWWGLPIKHAERPHLQRWYDAIRQLPAARGVLDLPLT